MPMQRALALALVLVLANAPVAAFAFALESKLRIQLLAARTCDGCEPTERVLSANAAGARA